MAKGFWPMKWLNDYSIWVKLTYCLNLVMRWRRKEKQIKNCMKCGSCPSTGRSVTVTHSWIKNLTTCPSERLWPGGHDNPYTGKWNLYASPVDYPHPSAKFYIEGLHAGYPVTNFMEMDVVVFVTLDIKGLDYEKADKYGWRNVPCGRRCWEKKRRYKLCASISGLPNVSAVL